MPNVSDEFVAHAEKLAHAAKDQLEKDAASNESLKANAEMTADTLIEQGLVPAAEKPAAIESLMDHEQALQALNKTAQMKGEAIKSASNEEAPASMGKAASTATEVSVDYRGEDMRESDVALLRGLGLGY